MRTFARSYFGLQKYEIIGKLNKINLIYCLAMNKKNISINSLCAIFLLVSISFNAVAQSTDAHEKYYSNPQKGIKPSLPEPYIDSNIASKSDNITVELTGYIPDTSKRDTTPAGFVLNRKALSTEGYSLYYDDPWYDCWHSSFYSPWFAWDYDYWMFNGCWSCGPYWGWSHAWCNRPYWGWGYGWGNPWYWNSWYWNSWYYPYYYADFYWGYPHYGLGNLNGGNRGYGLITNGRVNNNAASNGIGARPRTSSNTNPVRGTVRRGGVDLNNGGRAPRGQVSGTGTIANRGTSDASRGNAVASRGTTGRYAKPSTVTNQRNSSSSSRNASAYRGSSSHNSSSRTYSSSSSRGSSFESPSRGSSSFRSTSSSSRSSSSFRSNSSPSRSSSSSFRSSSSGSSFRSSGSSSHSSSSFRSSGGGSHRR